MIGTAVAEAVHDDRPWQVAIAVVAVADRPVSPPLAVRRAGRRRRGSDRREARWGRSRWPSWSSSTRSPRRGRGARRPSRPPCSSPATPWTPSPTGIRSHFGDMVAFAVQCAAAVALGLYFAARRATLDALHERAERMDRERELLADRAVAEERVRIAQELHDVVAHNVSLIVVKAQALGATVRDERVAEATDGIADLGRQTMAEMHRTLALLRTAGDDAAERAPQPGLGQPRPAPRAVARRGPRRQPRGRGRAARALPEPRPVGLPDRPGGADQRAQARGRRAQRRWLPPTGPGARADDRRQRRGPARRPPRRAGGHGLVGHARARGAVRRHARSPARATAAASRSAPSLPYGEGRA